jgi:protein phosphatase 1 regulatory subunit 11
MLTQSTTRINYAFRILLSSMANTAGRAGSSTSTPNDASRTITLHDSQPSPDDDAGNPFGVNGDVVGTLRLRGAHRSDRPRVAWADEVVDNEGMGKKKSKSACRLAAC